MTKFIDISSNNNFPRTLDNYKAIANGVNGVIVKVSQGSSYANPFAEQDITTFQSLNTQVAIYHYVDFFTTLDSDNCIANAKKFSNYEFLMLDVESATAFQSIANIPGYISTLEGLLPTVEIVVYCSYSKLVSIRTYYQGKVIIADWESETTADDLALNTPNCIGVQYTNKANVDNFIFDEYDIFSIPNVVSGDSTVPDNVIVGSELANNEVASQTLSLMTELVKWSVDNSGNGWIGVNIPYTNIISVIAQGSYPPVDGYWKLPKIGIQERVIDNFQTCISISEANPNSEVLLFIKYFA